MEKRSNFSSNRRAGVKIKTVSIRSLYPGRLTVAGSYSGDTYVFPQAGAEVKVDPLDVEVLLNKRRGGCCGGQPYALFELVKD